MTISGVLSFFLIVYESYFDVSFAVLAFERSVKIDWTMINSEDPCLPYDW